MDPTPQDVQLDTQVKGMLQVVSSVPSGVPHDLYDQVKIYAGSLYFYDWVNHAWDSSGGSVFSGRVSSTGTAIRLPSGWSVFRSSQGVYGVTHNLGTAGYSFVVTAITGTSAAAGWMYSGNSNSNFSEIHFVSVGLNAFVDTDFSFIASK